MLIWPGTAVHETGPAHATVRPSPDHRFAGPSPSSFCEDHEVAMSLHLTRRASAAKAMAVTKAIADQRASAVAPILAEIRAEGITTVAGIARALTARGVPAPRGGGWHRDSVLSALRRVH
ncbi:hypothetical protein [Methylobacterium sp. ID0610]|uniref:hypothetical protein n=1 Tax=Methylobacterium carpenticola TaxID=3344827 RepID=UPI0036777400